MRIKRLELSGFKSFSDRTVLTFEQGLSAVVGPNGCGKSNVVDALRWVMGEQSARHLRGRTAQDLIFSGSEARGAVSMAEVTMVLDLTDGVAPPRYAEYSELEITRRIFRDGKTEHFIQKIPCRLKDITDLFLGTGVHSRAYSIIEQVRIGQILTAKPEERRAVIEEAAGLTKYKQQKAASERRMERTRQNLERVNDIISEIERRLRSLRRQAKKAERYDLYAAEWKELDLWRMAHHFLDLDLQLGSTRKTLESNADSMADLADALAAAETRMDAQRLELTAAETRQSDVQEQLYETENRLKLLENQVAFKEQERVRLEQEGRQSQEEIENLRGDLEALQSERSSTEAILAELEASSDQRELVVAIRQEVTEGLRRELGRIRGELESARREAADLERVIAGQEGRTSAWERRRVQVRDRLSQIDHDRDELSGRLDRARPDKERLENLLSEKQEAIQDLEARREHLEERIEDLDASIQHGEIKVETLRSQLHRARSRLASLEEIQRRYEGFQQGTKAIMERRDGNGASKGIFGLVADIVSGPAELEPALEAVLGERIGNVVVESQDVGVDAVRFLKQKRRGRSSFIPLDVRARGDEPTMETTDGVRGPLIDAVEVPDRYRTVARYLFGDVVVTEDLPAALRAWRRVGGNASFVTLDGELVDAWGAISGGSAGDEGAGILGQKREIRELRNVAEDLEHQEQEAMASLMAVKQERAATAQELELVVRRIHDTQLGLLEARKDLAALVATLDETSRRISALDQERETLVRALDEEGAQVEESLVDVERKRRRIEELTEVQSRLEEEQHRLGRLLEDASTALTEVKVEAAQAGERRSAAAQALRRSIQERERLESRIAELTERVQTGHQRIGRLVQEVATSQEEVSSLAAQAQKLADVLSNARQECERLRTGLQESELSVRRLREQISAEERTRSATELDQERLLLEREHLLEEARKTHRLDLVGVLMDYHLRPAWSGEQSARLDELEGLLDRMRQDYNPMARKEYEELTERHEFLTTQRADIEEALERLGKALVRVNKESRARFTRTFEAINERFTRVFPRLFKGGKGELVLTESSDVLESGVEIVVQPPGKKLQSVELLSGGEKAMVAIALIFSVFLYRPSPFCVLDEVDAPLDDANVERYNTLIREMGRKTQFIVITHNKRTMEMVDVLYGVTMDEPGVSKIVRVNLKEAAEMAA